MSKDANKTQDGYIPTSVLNGLNQFTVGGFVLFYFNSENGMPEQVMTFDSPAHSMAMEKYMGEWLAALNSIHQQQTRAGIINEIKNNQEPPDNTAEIS